MPDYNPTIEQCKSQWYHNRDLLPRLDPEFNDWIITVTFYTVLHAVETLLTADAASNHSRHGSRHETLQNNPRYRAKIWPAYKVAYDLAHVARYSAQPRRWTRSSNIPSTLFERALYPIETEVAQLLSELKSPVKCESRQVISLKPIVTNTIPATNP